MLINDVDALDVSVLAVGEGGLEGIGVEDVAGLQIERLLEAEEDVVAAIAAWIGSEINGSGARGWP